MTFYVSGNLMRFSDYKREIEVQGDTVHAGLEAMIDRYPRLQSILLDGNGQVRKVFRIFVDGEQMLPDDLHKPVANTASVTILTPIAGG